MEKSLQEKTITGVLWSIVEQFGVVVFKFVLGIVLARLLSPSDFGLIGMVAVLFDIAGELVQGGFGQAYIQKKNASTKDAATTFYFNLFVSILIYLIFWLLAPSIAKFYNQDQLVLIIRVMSTVVLIDAIGMIQMATIMKNVNFKKSTIIALVSIAISGSVSIILAYKGFGVWALVFYTIINKLLSTAGLWIKSKGLSIRDFSIDSLKELFSYGSWLLFASLLKKIFENINVIVIGKFFPIAQLGFYSKAKQMQKMTSGQITVAVGRVAFPVFSLISSSKEKLQNGIRRFLQQVMLLILPIVASLFVVAHPFVHILLTDKWLPMVPYLKLFCIVGAVFPINAINIQVLVAQGHSKQNFVITFIKNTLRVLNVLIMFKFGVLYILFGEVSIAMLSLFINTYYTKKHLNYGLIKQLFDLRYHLLGGIIAILVGTLSNALIVNEYLFLFVGSLLTASTFFIFQLIFNKGAMDIIVTQKTKLSKKIRG